MDHDKSFQFTDKTLIPLFLILIMVPGIFYVAGIISKINDMNDLQKDYNETVIRINERLSRIEGKLGINLNSMSEEEKYEVPVTVHEFPI